MTALKKLHVNYMQKVPYPQIVIGGWGYTAEQIKFLEEERERIERELTPDDWADIEDAGCGEPWKKSDW